MVRLLQVLASIHVVIDETITAVGDRVTAIETWHSNFVEVSEEEINALFPSATPEA